MAVNNSLNNASTLWNVGASAAAATAAYPLTVGVASNASAGARFRNTSAGSSGLFQLEVSSDTAAGYLTVGSSTHTTARLLNRAELSDSTASAGVNITTTAAAGDIRMYVNSNTLAATMSSSAVLSLTNPLPASSGGTGGSALTGILTGNGASAMSASTVTQYAPLVGGASNAVSSTAVGSAGQVFRSSGAGVNPVWSTATFPATATTTGTVLRADGTNWVITQSTFADLYAASAILYSNGANNVAGLATANNAILNTSATGVPSITTTPSFGTLTLTGASLTPLNLESTDAGASTGPVIDCYRNSASPAALDALGTIGFTGMSSTAVKRTYASITANAIVVTNASEDGSLNLNIMSAGTLTTVGTVTKTGLNSVAIGATTVSTGAFSTLASTSATITTTGTAPLTITSTDAGAAAMVVDLYRDSASPLASDILSQLTFTGESSTGVKRTYGSILATALTVTNAAEDGLLSFEVQSGGTLTTQLIISNNLSRFTQPLEVITTGLTTLLVSSTDAGASSGPILDLYRNSASPLAADTIGEIDFNGKDSGGTKTRYGYIQCAINDPTDTTEDSTITIATVTAGAGVIYATMGNNLGQYRGTQTNTAAPAGFIGEVLSASLLAASQVSLTTTTDATVTSVALTAGNWMITGCVVCNGVLTGTRFRAGISATAATMTGTEGVNFVSTPTMPTASSNMSNNTPSVFVSLAGTTTYYLVAEATFTVGTASAYGSISAVRIG